MFDYENIIKQGVTENLKIDFAGTKAISTTDKKKGGVSLKITFYQTIPGILWNLPHAPSCSGLTNKPFLKGIVKSSVPQSSILQHLVFNFTYLLE